MLILAGSLAMNGGSTFVLRYAETRQKEFKKTDVLVLSKVVDASISTQLGKVANIFYMQDVTSSGFSILTKNQGAIFFPVHKKAVQKLLEKNNYCVHAMGIFGLVLAYKWLKDWPDLKITVGVYHQNEFFFDLNRFFIDEAKSMLSHLPKENMVFFDEYTRALYASSFNSDFTQSLLAPIGIKLPEINLDINRHYIPGKMVSVGNLVDFKTYNRHVITIMTDLVNHYPYLYYEIYGAGDQASALKELVKKLKLEKHVFFKGIIEYKNFANVVNDAMVFIGSGTALLEAASLGVPAIIGVESIKTPETYGFIYEVPGFTYNEMTTKLPLCLIKSRVETLLSGDALVVDTHGRKCHHKAQEFSMTVTVSAFNQLIAHAKKVSFTKNRFFWLKMLLSITKIAIFDVLNIDKQFKNRRNHSSLMKEN